MILRAGKVLLVLIYSAILTMGCGAKEVKTKPISPKTEIQSETLQYTSPTQKEDCQRCGDGKGTLLSAYWGENNLGIIDLNQFQLAHIEINPYETWGKYTKEDYGRSSTDLINTGEGGLSVWGTTDPDRGYYSGEIFLASSNVLDVSQAAQFLCTDCLNQIVPKGGEPHFNIGIINFKTKEIRLLEEHVSAFMFDDYYVSCEYVETIRQDEKERRFDLLIFYCPPRFTE